MKWDELQKQVIIEMMVRIEDKSKMMIHETPLLRIQLKAWQDGLFTNFQFKEMLTKYWDIINK